jgi:hypothetical protein
MIGICVKFLCEMTIHVYILLLLRLLCRFAPLVLFSLPVYYNHDRVSLVCYSLAAGRHRQFSTTIIRNHSIIMRRPERKYGV